MAEFGMNSKEMVEITREFYNDSVEIMKNGIIKPRRLIKNKDNTSSQIEEKKDTVNSFIKNVSTSIKDYDKFLTKNIEDFSRVNRQLQSKISLLELELSNLKESISKTSQRINTTHNDISMLKSELSKTNNLKLRLINESEEKQDYINYLRSELKNKQEEKRRKNVLAQRIEVFDKMQEEYIRIKQSILDKKLAIKTLASRQRKYCIFQKYLRNRTQELKGNIRVFCRVRPVIPSMDDENDIACKRGVNEVIHISSLHKIEVFAPSTNAKDEGLKSSKNSSLKHAFDFDAVFGVNASQEDLFKEVYHLVLSALDGYKACIFAYGQTGSGKTYTMEGDVSDDRERGIIPRAIDSLFEIIKNNQKYGWIYLIESSFQEIYMEQIRDLLLPENSMKQLNKASEYEPTIVAVK